MAKHKDKKKRRKISFKEGTRAAKERSRIAEGIKRENPGISDERKFALATAAVKKKLRRAR